ncbi:ATP-binding protein [Dactylosporangium sucinum]|nr:ATP-binding protein [Dactylosporangium sucinum]
MVPPDKTVTRRGAEPPPKPEPARVDVADTPIEFEPRTPRRTIADLIVPAEVRTRIDLAVKQLENHDELYLKWNLRKVDPYRTGTALNFYGAPGTGKSLAAEAVAARLGRSFIDVSYAEIESKYVGDTPKNIVRCFEQARQMNAVLVFNEADSILGSRLSSVTQSADHSVNVSRAVMLAQLDAFGGLVVFTTNFPRNYDAAFVRRILVHVRFDLPDLATRVRLWRHLIPEDMPRETGFTVERLAEASDGLAGGDMVNALKAAGAEAASRPHPRHHLELADLMREIDQIRRAKAEVGKAHGGLRHTSIETVDEMPDA